MVLIVTGFRVVVSAAPRGECELHRAGTIGISLRGTDLDDEDNLGRQICEAIRGMFMVARDSINVLQIPKEVVV